MILSENFCYEKIRMPKTYPLCVGYATGSIPIRPIMICVTILLIAEARCSLAISS